MVPILEMHLEITHAITRNIKLNPMVSVRHTSHKFTTNLPRAV
jgi:hypothetical protein